MHIRTTGNSAPAVYWAVFEVLSRPDLVTRVRNIAQSAHETRSQDPVSVELGNNPLLRSIFAEVTRLRVVGMVARLVTGGDFQLGRWSIPEGSIVGLPSQTRALNKDFWNAGTEEDPHPLRDFWEERFLIYADKLSSGPLRRQMTDFCSNKQEPALRSSGKASDEPKFLQRALNRVYTPFDGGLAPCPGRQFAKQAVTSTLAKFVLDYDVELQVPNGGNRRLIPRFSR